MIEKKTWGTGLLHVARDRVILRHSRPAEVSAAARARVERLGTTLHSYAIRVC